MQSPRTPAECVLVLAWPVSQMFCRLQFCEPPDTPAVVTCSFSVALLGPCPFHQFPAFGMPSLLCHDHGNVSSSSSHVLLGI